MSDFSTLNLIPPIFKNLQKVGYLQPTPIQSQAIPPLLDGRDLLGIAQTGTGKTAAFALPILNRLALHPRKVGPRRTRVLILTPTRELASQIDASFATYGAGLSLSRALVFGGVGQGPQVRAMSRKVDILTATPGRLLDLIGQGHIKLDRLEVFVLDEADRMLDMGFIHDIRRVIAMLPPERQTLMFSATMPKDIAVLAEGLLRDPVRAEVTPQATTVERIDQQVMFVERSNKRKLLREILAQEKVFHRALVFTRTKHAADRVVEDLEKASISASAIHGNKSQGARERALAAFRGGRIRVLVATDIAARGLDVDNVSHVINYDLPNEPESYVHRIGRTARAGKDGSAVSFCDVDERGFLREIERLIGMEVRRNVEHMYHSEIALRGSGGSSANILGRNASGGGRKPQQQQRGQRSAGGGDYAAKRSASGGDYAAKRSAGGGDYAAKRSVAGSDGMAKQPRRRVGRPDGQLEGAELPAYRVADANARRGNGSRPRGAAPRKAA